jgi:hypothetical protein
MGRIQPFDAYATKGCMQRPAPHPGPLSAGNPTPVVGRVPLRGVSPVLWTLDTLGSGRWPVILRNESPVYLPKGDLLLARQFYCGVPFAVPLVPAGTAEPAHALYESGDVVLQCRSAVPLGTCRSCCPFQALKRLAIFTASLREKSTGAAPRIGGGKIILLTLKDCIRFAG